jgi:hypothetical protein
MIGNQTSLFSSMHISLQLVSSRPVYTLTPGACSWGRGVEEGDRDVDISLI